jgi:hypothetical protein
MHYIYSGQEIVWIRKLADGYVRGINSGSMTLDSDDRAAVGVSPENIIAILQTFVDHGLIYDVSHTSSGRFNYFLIHANIVQVLRRIEAEETAKMLSEQTLRDQRESNERRDRDQRDWQDRQTRTGRWWALLSGVLTTVLGFTLGSFRSQPQQPVIKMEPTPITVVVPADAIQKAK